MISIAISPDGALLAAAGIGGTVAVIDRKARTLARTLVGPGLPVWSVAFLPDSRTLLTGGADNIIRRWNAATGEPVDPILLETAGDPLAAYAGDRGAEIFRACVACHTLGADQANRAGPTLAGIFGRRIATAPVTIFPKRSSGSISSGRRRRFQNCSRSGRRPIRPAPRCRSNASARNRIAPRSCNSSSARRRNRADRRVGYPGAVNASPASNNTSDMSSNSSIGSLVTPAAVGDFFDSATPVVTVGPVGRNDRMRTQRGCDSEQGDCDESGNQQTLHGKLRWLICSVACTTALRPTVTRECVLRHLSRSCF